MATKMFVPGQKMEGFGSGPVVSAGGTGEKKSVFKALSSFASTAADAIKPDNHPDKRGATTGDARRAAAEVFWTFSGNCKVTGSVKTVQDRMACGCVGCASWDNEKILRQNQEAELEELKQLEMQRAIAAREAEEASFASTAKGGYQAPTPAALQQQSAPSNYTSTQAPRAPWGPSSTSQQAAPKQRAAPVLREEPMAPVDLMGMNAPTPVESAAVADLLGDDSGSGGLTNAFGEPIASSGFDLLGDNVASPTDAPVLDLLDVGSAPAATSGVFDPFAPPAAAAAAPSSSFGFVQGNAKPANAMPVQQPASFDPFASSAPTKQANAPSSMSSMFAGMSLKTGAPAAAPQAPPSTFMMMA